MNKSIFSIFLVLLLVSCADSNDPSEPIIPQDKYLFNVKTGKIWTYEKNGVEASFFVSNFDSCDWVIEFWDTLPKSKLPTYTLEWKELDNGFPRYTDFGLAVTDSSYIFGTKKHPFVSPSYPTDFFVFMFEIPKNLTDNYSKQIEFNKNIGSETLFWKNTFSFTKSDNIIFNNILLKRWNLLFVAERKRPNPTIYSEGFTIVDSLGFYSFRNYLLKKIEE